MNTRALIACGLAAVALASIARGEGPHGYTAEEASRLRRAITLDNWDDGGEISRFTYLNTSQVFPVALIRRGGPIRPLPVELNPAIGRYVVDKVGDRSISLDQFLGEGSFDGFVVVHHGRIVYEVYPRMQPEARHLMFSVSKAFVGTVVAILEDRGRVRIDRPASEYIAELKGTAWEKISVRDILEMASGIEGGEWTGEPYKDPSHKHYQVEASLGTLPKTPAMPDSVQRDDTYRYLLTLGRCASPACAGSTPAPTPSCSAGWSSALRASHWPMPSPTRSGRAWARRATRR
jgi:hypothetical protein